MQIVRQAEVTKKITSFIFLLSLLLSHFLMAMKKLALIRFLNYGPLIPSPEPIATPTGPVWL